MRHDQTLACLQELDLELPTHTILNTPRNRDLPPEQRSARPAEIEAYIEARDAEQGPS